MSSFLASLLVTVYASIFFGFFSNETNASSYATSQIDSRVVGTIVFGVCVMAFDRMIYRYWEPNAHKGAVSARLPTVVKLSKE